MDAIIFKDNVYVYIERKECKDENIMQKEEVFKFPGNYNLYGGRVEIRLSNNISSLTIDGISIITIVR